jgi:membrane associated rhomboid family serine protease
MGAVLLLFFPASDLGSTRILNQYARQIPRMGLARALADRRILAASAAIVGLNLLLATSFGGFLAGGGIAWEAHLGGYFFGLLTFGWFDDGPVEPPRPAEPDQDIPPPLPPE